MTSRREFVERSALSALGLMIPVPGTARNTASNIGRPQSSFLDVSREPDLVAVQTGDRNLKLRTEGAERWTNGGITVVTSRRDGALGVALSAPETDVQRIYLRWRGDLSSVRLLLGDAWERAYGDLEWRSWVPDRIMPWYFATRDASLTNCYGVRTGARALCFWQADEQGMSLCADVRSGSSGVELGERTLDVCDVVCRAGTEDESAFVALHEFCFRMCSSPRIPSHPIYGSNDWYWAYGRNSAATVRADAQHIVELSPAGTNRPFVVIDDGWQPGRGEQKSGAGRWDGSNEKFPDMPDLAAEIRRIGARPGIWIRPLQAPEESPTGWRLSRNEGVLDPTVPEVLQKVRSDIARLREWGFELIKHDYTTFDIMGRWGFQMGTELVRGRLSFASGTGLTTAEVINELYATIREAAGDDLVIGCNTVAHLSAGKFELCRIGDDTSGTEWARTRKMGVNSLAFRGAQHGAFFVADADCVGVTNQVPWSFNRQWLDLLATSGTSLFVSLAPDALGADQRRDLGAALRTAAQTQPLGEPLDWLSSTCPERWRLSGTERQFEWVGEDGVGLP